VDAVVEYGRHARSQLETIANASERIAELEEEESSAVVEST